MGTDVVKNIVFRGGGGAKKESEKCDRWENQREDYQTVPRLAFRKSRLLQYRQEVLQKRCGWAALAKDPRKRRETQSVEPEKSSRRSLLGRQNCHPRRRIGITGVCF